MTDNIQQSIWKCEDCDYETKNTLKGILHAIFHPSLKSLLSKKYKNHTMVKKFD